MSFRVPERIHAALLPTPLEPLSRYSAALPDVDVWIKRDDLTGFLYSGNKIRKLEFSFARAFEEDAAGVVTCGGVNSNHCRATAALAARLGLECHLFLRTPSGEPPGELQGNTLIDAIMGATIRWITPDEYRVRDELMNNYAHAAGREGQRLHVIPEGASDGTGALGYVLAVKEIEEQAEARGIVFDAVVHAMGSGGTTAGLCAGRTWFGAPWRVIGVPVCDNAAYFRTRVREILDPRAPRGLKVTGAEPLGDVDEFLDIWDGFQGRGYGLTTPEELEALRDTARLEGILLDPCYTGKAFRAMDASIRAGHFRSGARVLFLHTGGALANFAYGEEWAEVLR